MFKRFTPTYVASNVYEIEIDKFLKLNIKCILCDLDNTLDAYYQKTPSKEAIEFNNKLKENGIELILTSNNTKSRVQKYAEMLGVKYSYTCKKPLIGKVKKLIKSLNYSKSDYLIIGDQVFTDILFYSSEQQNMLSAIKKQLPAIDGVYITKREYSTFTAKAQGIIQKIVKRSEDVVNLRGFVLDNTSLNAREFNESENNGTKEYSITLLYGESYKLAPKFSDYATSNKVDYEIIEGNDFINIDASGQISLKNIGNVKVKMSCGDNNSLFKYSVILNINIIRDTTDIFKDFAFFIRKSFGHFGLFFFIGFLSCVFMVIQFKSFFTRVLASIGSSCLGITLAILTEFIQKFVPGRGPSLKDVGIDVIGYLSAMIIFIIVVGIIYIVKKVKASKVDKKYSIVSKPSTFKTID